MCHLIFFPSCINKTLNKVFYFLLTDNLSLRRPLADNLSARGGLPDNLSVGRGLSDNLSVRRGLTDNLSAIAAVKANIILINDGNTLLLATL